MRKFIALILCIIVVISATACNSRDSVAKAVYPGIESSNKKELKNWEFINTVNDFSFVTTSKILSGKSENVTYSPISLYFALSVAASGANALTRDEMFELLGVKDTNYLVKENSKLFRLLYTDEEISKLKIANSLWLKKGNEFKEAFIDNAVEEFYASLYSVNFGDKKTNDLMSKWISENTNGLITPEVETKGNQLLSIINTIYLKDEWRDQFSEGSTKSDNFHLNNDDLVQVDFMNQSIYSSSYVNGDGFISSSLKLKILGEMVFVLPDVGVNVEDLLSSPGKVAEIFNKENRENAMVDFQIPKFEFGSKFELIDTLKELGMNSAFGVGADFSGISKNSAYISMIKQETFIAIDEKGVEAAAYTQIDMVESATMEETIVEMTLDRPFIFGIRSDDGVLLFVGIVNNPLEK